MFRTKKLKRLVRHHTEHVSSMDFLKIPPEMRKCIPDEDFAAILLLPYIRLEDRTLLVNESFDGGDSSMKDLLVSLDMLPISLLHDIYAMDHKRFGEISIGDIGQGNDDTVHRRLVYFILPDVLWAHGDDTKSNFEFLNR